ncbi:MAG: DUF1254 domain-containing protein [Hyphomicrobiales bacterium]|nr:DUF1254 domain-containing protein [Hyphomicrobiales bacterium]MCP4998432.1 DUF1254 domain-containing protein [Hyphomicrobiales bacterium]
MSRLFYVVLSGIAGAALLHIVIILSIPAYADRDAWTKITALGPTEFFHILPANKPGGLTSANPFIRTAVCRFDISEEPVRVTASELSYYWSLAIFDPGANEIYSMNDRTATDQNLDIAVVTPLQMIAYRKSLPETLADSVLIEFPGTTGYLVLRTVVPDSSWELIVRDFLSNALCQSANAF